MNTSVYSMDTINSFFDEIDVMILCGGSATDPPKQSPELVEHFNIVTVSTPTQNPEHFGNVDEIAKIRKVGLISVGWDPAIFHATPFV